MMILKDDLLSHLHERIDVIAKQCVSNRDLDHDQTQYERGRYAAHREIVSWLETHFNDS